jgi:hypothetical protein
VARSRSGNSVLSPQRYGRLEAWSGDGLAGATCLVGYPAHSEGPSPAGDGGFIHPVGDAVQAPPLAAMLHMLVNFAIDGGQVCYRCCLALLPVRVEDGRPFFCYNCSAMFAKKVQMFCYDISDEIFIDISDEGFVMSICNLDILFLLQQFFAFATITQCVCYGDLRRGLR